MSSEKQASSPADRLTSVDALRGFDMFWIIGGGEIVRGLFKALSLPVSNPLRHQFEHAEWIGFTAWDLIMPLFLFIVGTSIPLSFAKRLERGDTKRQIYLHVVRRIVILFVLGMVAQGNLLAFDLSKLHIYCNTLQAIACGYLIASIAVLNVNIAWQGAITAGLLVLYWLLMMLVPVPGHGAGMLTPHGNLAMYVDEIILRGFRDGTTYTWILSSLTFAATVLLGVMSGHLLRSKTSPQRKALLLLASGIAGVMLGLVTSIWFPIIKHIWTSSFVLFSAGLSYLLLALFYWLTDMLGYRKWAFGFVVIGMNAILVYMVTRLIDFADIVHALIGFVTAHIGVWNGVVEPTLGFAIVWLALFLMYRKRIFVKI
jgi:predicted acyltransferase